MNLPIEERAVRIAQLDTAGNDIGKAINDLNEDTDDLAVALAEVQAAVEGKVAFDGEITVVRTGQYDCIPADSLPTNTSGIYRLKGNARGILLATSNPGGSKYIAYTDGDELIYSKFFYPGETLTDFNFSPTNSRLKPIYCHPITLTGAPGDDMRLTMLIFNNSPTPFTKATFIDWLDNLFSSIGGTVRVMASGGYIYSSVPQIASYIGKSSSDYFAIGCSASDGTSSYRSFTKANFETWIYDLNDGVNRIN